MIHLLRNSLIALTAACALPAAADTVTQWDFNSSTPDATPLTGTTTPAIGSGTASGVGGVDASLYFAGSSTDPAFAGGDNSGWSLKTFPASDVNNKSAGAQFAVNTTGFVDISVSFDVRHSGTASKFERFQYSLNGTDFVDLEVFSGVGTSFATRSVNLASIGGAGDNPNFAFRVVSEFENTATGSGSASYVLTSGSSPYGTSGTWRFDMVGVSGTRVSPVPEPTTAMLGLAGAGALALRARRRR
jgi:MYXO-CTERM domain-containing protein